MQLTTRVKLFLKQNTPKPVFNTIRFIADKTLLQIIPLFFKIRIFNFNKKYFKKVSFKDFSFQIEINPANGYLDAQIHARGLYEPHIIETMHTYIKTGDTCLDIGANIGHHTILMSHFAGSSGHVFAYEPIPYLRDQMSRSLLINSIHNVTLRDMALSDNEGEMTLYLRKENIGGSSLLSDINTKELPVQVTTLDTHHVGKVNFMKIDVEGYEYHVLLGGKKNIETYRPIIIFEWSPIYYRIHNESHMKGILQFFKERNYTLLDIENRNKRITNTEEFISEFQAGLRSQTNILALPL